MLSLSSRTPKFNTLPWDKALRIAVRQLERRGGVILGGNNRLPDSERQLIGGGRVVFLQNTAFTVGPVALSDTLTTNIFNPGTTTGGVNCTSAPFDKLYVILRQMTVHNVTGTAATVSLWMGATGGNAAGTEFVWTAKSVPANDYITFYFQPGYRMGTTKFLVGGSGTASALTITLTGEIGIGA